ncbi:hypothetical protein B0H13DRAFT_1857061 [Mycena leptocephala]|nr:hypothetical protein B0H13DRAFT_1857061 [Mycena leptocephala]
MSQTFCTLSKELQLQLRARVIFLALVERQSGFRAAYLNEGPFGIRPYPDDTGDNPKPGEPSVITAQACANTTRSVKLRLIGNVRYIWDSTNKEEKTVDISQVPQYLQKGRINFALIPWPLDPFPRCFDRSSPPRCFRPSQFKAESVDQYMNGVPSSLKSSIRLQLLSAFDPEVWIAHTDIWGLNEALDTINRAIQRSSGLDDSHARPDTASEQEHCKEG